MSKNTLDDSNEDIDPNLPHENDDDGFGLIAPTGELVAPAGTEGNAGFDDMAPRPQAKSDESLRQTGWRGFEETLPEEVDEDPDVSFVRKEPMPQDEMDMTPMVDVVFLLLIFFMVTASFILQQSIETPPATSNEASTQSTEEEQRDEYVEVIIDQNNTYFVTVRDSAEEECPSDREMRSRIRNAKVDFGAKHLVIKAHVDAFHRKVVTVWDAGVANGLEKIEIQIQEEDF